MVPKTTHKKIILDDMEQPVPCRPRLAASKLKLPHGCGGLGLAGLAVQLGWQLGWAGSWAGLGLGLVGSEKHKSKNGIFEFSRF